MLFGPSLADKKCLMIGTFSHNFVWQHYALMPSSGASNRFDGASPDGPRHGATNLDPPKKNRSASWKKK
jgi:hypothetical protein